MASVGKSKLRSDIKDLLKGADLTQLSAKKVRKQLEDKYSISLLERKKEVDDILMQLITESQSQEEQSSPPPPSPKANRSRSLSDSRNSSQEAVENGQEEDEDEERAPPSASEPEDDSDFDMPENMGPSPKKKRRGEKRVDDAQLARELQDEEEVCTRQTRGGNKRAVKKSNPPKKRKKAGGKPKTNRYTQPCILSQKLADIVGTDRLPRSDVVKKMWEIINEKDLKDPKNRQFIICDGELQKLFGRRRVRTFGMMKYLQHHIFNPDDVADQ